MSASGPRESASKATEAKPDARALRLLGAVARIAVLVGAAVSVGLMLYVGRRNPSTILLILFTLWVLSPFVAVGLAESFSKHWSLPTRAAIHGVMLILTLGSLAIY